jgi:hypothetical protein
LILGSGRSSVKRDALEVLLLPSLVVSFEERSWSLNETLLRDFADGILTRAGKSFEDSEVFPIDFLPACRIFFRVSRDLEIRSFVAVGGFPGSGG